MLKLGGWGSTSQVLIHPVADPLLTEVELGPDIFEVHTVIM
jgi:hypothetical protein